VAVPLSNFLQADLQKHAPHTHSKASEPKPPHAHTWIPYQRNAPAKHTPQPPDSLEPQRPADAKGEQPSRDADQCQPVCALWIGWLNQPRSNITPTTHTKRKACQPTPHAINCRRHTTNDCCIMKLLTGAGTLRQTQMARSSSSCSSSLGLLLISRELSCLSGGVVDHLPPD
jgi:hypothetical protein